MKPKSAAECVLKGVFTHTDYYYWIGPKFFNIWGKPNTKKLNTCKVNESKTISKIADKIYRNLKEQ